MFFAISDEVPVLNLDEADDWCYRSVEQIQQEMRDNPAKFTPWFLHTFPRIPNTLGDFRLTA